jgi:hypothetical protein
MNRPPLPSPTVRRLHKDEFLFVGGPKDGVVEKLPLGQQKVACLSKDDDTASAHWYELLPVHVGGRKWMVYYHTATLTREETIDQLLAYYNPPNSEAITWMRNEIERLRDQLRTLQGSS